MSGKRFHISNISIGSNLGNRYKFIESAIEEIRKIPSKILKSSKILETKALDFTNQPDFLNCIIQIETDLTALELLDSLQSIEKRLGRVKRFDKGPREIDLDILTFDQEVVNESRLTIPHHSVQTRPFIKELLIDIEN